MAPLSPLRRWIAFNAVGTLGIVLQLVALAVLLRAGLPLVVATLIAVEAAILHNFAWHEQWTFAGTKAGTLAERLVRFHALNGVTSLVGNVAITAALTQLGVHPVLANLAAITACGFVNFFAADRLVFRAGAAALVLALAAPTPLAASDDMLANGPTPATLAAWNKYVAAVDARYWKATADGSFFALDARQAANWRARAKTEVAMIEVPPTSVPDGKIHHWAGAIYVPNTTVAAVVKRMQDYAGRESEFYREVKASKLLERNGDKVRVFMRLERRAFKVTGTYNTEHAVEYRTLGTHRASSRSISTKVAELEDAGTPKERELPAGQDSGFLWRLNAYWRFEQAGDGVLIECESVSLSRAVPWALRPFVTGLVEGVARESLEGTLRSLRAFLGR